MFNILAIFPQSGQSIGFDYISIGFIVVIILCLIVYTVKGFASSLVSLCAGLGSIILAILLAKPVGTALASTTLGANIYNPIFEWINSSLGSSAALPMTEEGIASALETLKIPDLLAKPLTELIASMGTSDLSIGEALASSLNTYAWIAISFVVLWIVFLIVFMLLGKLVKNINKLPIVGLINHLLGGVLGLAIGLLICFVACYVIQLISSVSGDVGTKLSEMMYLNDDSVWSISKMLYEINFIPKILEALF